MGRTWECKTPTNRDWFTQVHFQKTRMIIPTKAPHTQIDNRWCMNNLRPVFENAHVDSITPQHVALYRDKRSAKVCANVRSHYSAISLILPENGLYKKENP